MPRGQSRRNFFRSLRPNGSVTCPLATIVPEPDDLGCGSRQQTRSSFPTFTNEVQPMVLQREGEAQKHGDTATGQCAEPNPLGSILRTDECNCLSS